ncbi:alpha/beta hydrolase [Devosia sp.]|uniref:alpha/beta hydrolase n=1 Tax=Devosia sp. TaxID=1871048 RepID=UPI00292E78E2|nr:alpha/beta hydrolase [Devosia sp.]
MAISLLSVFNALSPKDQGSRQVARDLPYGPGVRHRLDIYAPRQADGPAPVVFFVYGGSWMDGDRRNYGFAGRALAALGYVTVIADYRLVPEIEYPGFLADGVAAFAWVAEHVGRYGGDARRMALMGHSAGAYNAAMLALDPAYLGRAALLDRVRCVVGLSGPYDFYPFDGPISLRTFGAVSDPMATQPIHHVTPAAPPMLLGHGGKDRLVYPRNSVALAQRLRRAGVAVEEVHYAGLGHAEPLLALSRPARGMAPVVEDVASFLRRHLAV